MVAHAAVSRSELHLSDGTAWRETGVAAGPVDYQLSVCSKVCEIGVKQLLRTNLESDMDAIRPAPPQPSPRQRSARVPALSVSVGVGALLLGLMASAAGLQELTAFRHLKPGWIRYQPPWTVPVFVGGLVLTLVGLGTLAVTRIMSRRER